MLRLYIAIATVASYLAIYPIALQGIDFFHLVLEGCNENAHRRWHYTDQWDWW